MQSTAILIFACSAKEESRRKKLVRDPCENLILFEKLNQRTYTLVRSTGLPYFIFDECKQEGDSYGARIANAISCVYYFGFDKVIVVYNNCLRLSLLHIDNTMAAFKQSKLVIGPDNYGGAYLIGIDKSIFNKSSFSLLHWETNLLCHDLKCYDSPKVLLPRLRVFDNVNSTRIIAISEWISTYIKMFYFPIPLKSKWNNLKAVFIKHRLFHNR